MESGRPKINYEELQIRPDGSQAWHIISKVPMYDRDGQVIGLLGTYADITERKLMEDEIRQTNAYLENIFENSPDAISIVDNHGRFIRWNKMAEDLYGYTFKRACVQRPLPGNCWHLAEDRPPSRGYSI
jgi:PAS domain-containing protein